MGSRRAQKGRKDARPLTREETLEAVARVIEEAFDRLDNRYTKRSEKLSWSRVIVSGAAAAAPLLRDRDLDEIQARVAALEETAKQKR